MLAELGQLAIALAFCLALVQSVAFTRPAAAVALARGQLFFLAAALVMLAMLFVRHDFSVAYIANNSNSALPLRYRLSAVWGGHEGSMLLWVFMLAFWTCAVSVFARRMPAVLRARVISILAIISAGFLAFVLFVSSPFMRLIPPPIEGRDLNPLLQDPGLIFHPPVLYMGYVGFSVAFAFAVAALIDKKTDAAFAKWARPWVLAAWIFLTLGITLGSWWAYYELGWGGWWFWDPVENASFMPWLTGTALLHSIAATENQTMDGVVGDIDFFVMFAGRVWWKTPLLPILSSLRRDCRCAKSCPCPEKRMLPPKANRRPPPSMRLPNR